MSKLVILIGVFFLGGCLVRTYTTEKPRVDTDIQGNRGYLVGSGSLEQPDSIPNKTRKVKVIEIELGSHTPKEYKTKEEEPQNSSFEPTHLDYNEDIEEQDVVTPDELVMQEKKENIYEYYSVQKNDTLQKISQKFYGSTKKWKFIYDENKDILKSPDSIYPGQTIKIPSLK